MASKAKPNSPKRRCPYLDPPRPVTIERYQVVRSHPRIPGGRSWKYPHLVVAELKAIESCMRSDWGCWIDEGGNPWKTAARLSDDHNQELHQRQIESLEQLTGKRIDWKEKRVPLQYRRSIRFKKQRVYCSVQVDEALAHRARVRQEQRKRPIELTREQVFELTGWRLTDADTRRRLEEILGKPFTTAIKQTPRGNGYLRLSEMFKRAEIDEARMRVKQIARNWGIWMDDRGRIWKSPARHAHDLKKPKGKFETRAIQRLQKQLGVSFSTVERKVPINDGSIKLVEATLYRDDQMRAAIKGAAVPADQTTPAKPKPKRDHSRRTQARTDRAHWICKRLETPDSRGQLPTDDTVQHELRAIAASNGWNPSTNIRQEVRWLCDLMKLRARPNRRSKGRPSKSDSQKSRAAV
jgi:hypothetical protein